MEKEPKKLTQIVDEIISLRKTGSNDILPETISMFNQTLKVSGRSQQKDALELIKSNHEVLGEAVSAKMTEEIEESLDLYGKLS